MWYYRIGEFLVQALDRSTYEKFFQFFQIFHFRMDVPQIQGAGLRVVGRTRRFYSSSACPAEHFLEQQIIFDLTFCGQWAGRDFEVAMAGPGHIVKITGSVGHELPCSISFKHGHRAASMWEQCGWWMHMVAYISKNKP